MENILTIMVWLGTVVVFMHYRRRFSRQSSTLSVAISKREPKAEAAPSGAVEFKGAKQAVLP